MVCHPPTHASAADRLTGGNRIWKDKYNEGGEEKEKEKCKK